jgi:lipopolysaccharide transport system permease protein
MSPDVTANVLREAELSTSLGPTPTEPTIAPSIVIRASKGWRAINFRELWEYRELLYFFVWKDIKIRYKQTVLGIAWAVLQPVIMALIFTFLFSSVAHLSSGKLPSGEPIPYLPFVFSALLPWNLFARGLTDGSMSLAENQALVTKIYFPRILLPVAATLSALVDFGISVGVLVVIMVYYQILPSINVIFLPLFLLFAVLASVGVSLWLSALNAKYRDVRYTVPFLAQIWLFATPVMYAAGYVTATGVLGTVYALNPMFSVVEGFRWALFGSTFAFTTLSWISVAMVLTIFVGGLYYFRRAERTLADVV